MIVPESGFTAPVMILISVDLPAPFSPTSAWTSPARSSKETPFSACTPAKDLVIAAASSRAIQNCLLCDFFFAAICAFARNFFDSSSTSGIASAWAVNAQYSASRRAFAGSQRYAGTPNSFPRSTIARRDSGIGDTPNSMPRVSVLPFHGACVRLFSSSLIPNHGKSAASTRTRTPGARPVRTPQSMPSRAQGPSDAW